ncbi:hypothetical protein TNCV_1434571 [Trichonephila clavipes]|nr:hypothetical protein TNCV_1434571 [Trichonephila clavipes]
MTQHFWNRWSSEYLTLLQSRSKWRIVQKSLDIGDLVLIKHDNSPPLQWKLGKSRKHSLVQQEMAFPNRTKKQQVSLSSAPDDGPSNFDPWSCDEDDT